MRKKIVLPYIFIALFLVVSVILSIHIFPSQSTAQLITFTITVASFVIATVSFTISIRTYFSIDSVNAITKMEGNVLENSSYVTSFTNILHEYNQTNSKGISDLLFKNFEKRFSKRFYTAIEFASDLQYFIDLIVVFPFLFNSADKYQKEHIEKMNHILNLIDKQKNGLLIVSTGNLILIEETVKLIYGVIDYQKIITTSKYKMNSLLLEVRGTLLKNAVTQTIYYDYLGLFYNKKAMYLIRERINLGARDIFEIAALKEVLESSHMIKNEEFELVTMYLSESMSAYKKALNTCQEDLLWQGFIHANYARSTFFLQLITGDAGEDWTVSMNKAILYRKRLNMLLKDYLDDNKPQTHLQKALIYQEYLARFVKMNILIAQGIDVTDTRNIPKYMAPNYEGIEKDYLINNDYCGPFARIRGYQEAIREIIANNLME